MVNVGLVDQGRDRQTAREHKRTAGRRKRRTDHRAAGTDHCGAAARDLRAYSQTRYVLRAAGDRRDWTVTFDTETTTPRSSADC
jgi:hypothetical protein